MRLGMSVFTHGTLRKFWNSYSSIAAENRRKVESMRRAVARLIHRGKSLGFETWAQKWSEHRRQMKRVSMAALIGRVVV